MLFHRHVFLFLLLLVFLVAPSALIADPSDDSPTLEQMINESVLIFPFSEENAIRLAAYTELRGRRDKRNGAVEVQFGGLGSLKVFSENCLLRTWDNGVYHLNRENESPEDVQLFNQRLSSIFEHIALLGNADAGQAKREFIDAGLARKNIEPFTKMFVRHILLTYGQFSADSQEVVFESDWLPEAVLTDFGNDQKVLVKKPAFPLRMKLSKSILRGFYLRSGGTVFVEDVQREVRYATGEDYTTNVAAFKLFVQKLFVQSVQYVASTETSRLQPAQQAFRSLEPQTPRTPITAVNRPLYHPDNWLLMMLGMMRAQGVNIGDPEIIRFFIDAPYFPTLYQLLVPEERALVDAYRG